MSWLALVIGCTAHQQLLLAAMLISDPLAGPIVPGMHQHAGCPRRGLHVEGSHAGTCSSSDRAGIHSVGLDCSDLASCLLRLAKYGSMVGHVYTHGVVQPVRGPMAVHATASAPSFIYG